MLSDHQNKKRPGRTRINLIEGGVKMYVLVTVCSGIIDNVIFFDNGSSAVRALGDFVKTMNVEKDDAAVGRGTGADGHTLRPGEYHRQSSQRPADKRPQHDYRRRAPGGGQVQGSQLAVQVFTVVIQR